MSTTLFAELIKNAIPFIENKKQRLLDSIPSKEFNELAAKQIESLKSVASPICTEIKNQLNNGTYQGLMPDKVEPIRQAFVEILEELKKSEEFKKFVQDNKLSPEQINKLYHGYLFKFQNALIAGETSPAINLFLGEVFTQVVDAPESSIQACVDKISENLARKTNSKILGDDRNTPLADYTEQAAIENTLISIMGMPAYELLGAAAPEVLSAQLQNYADSINDQKKAKIQPAILFLQKFVETNKIIITIGERIKNASTVSSLENIEKRISELKESEAFSGLNAGGKEIILKKINKLQESIVEKKEAFEQKNNHIAESENAAKKLRKLIIEFARVVDAKGDIKALIALTVVLKDPKLLQEAIKDISNKSMVAQLNKIAAICEALNPKVEGIERNLRNTSGSVGPHETIIPHVDGYQALLKVIKQPNLNLLLAQMLLDERLPISAFAAENGDNLKSLNDYLNGGQPPVSKLQTSNSKGGSVTDDELSKLNNIFNSKTNDLNTKPVSESKLLLLKGEHHRQQLIRGEAEIGLKVKDEVLSNMLISNPKIRIKNKDDVKKLNQLVEDLTEGKVNSAKFIKSFHQITGCVLKKKEVLTLLKVPQAGLQNNNAQQLNIDQLNTIKTRFDVKSKELKSHKHFASDEILESLKNLSADFKSLNTAKRTITKAGSLIHLGQTSQAAEHKVALGAFRQTKHATASYLSNVLDILKQEHVEVKRAIKSCEKQLASGEQQDATLQQQIQLKLTRLEKIAENVQTALRDLSIDSKTINNLTTSFAKMSSLLEESQLKLNVLDIPKAGVASTVPMFENPFFKPKSNAATQASSSVTVEQETAAGNTNGQNWQTFNTIK